MAAEAGGNAVARAIRRCGFTAREWQASSGSQADLGSPWVLKRLLADLRHGSVLGLFVGLGVHASTPLRHAVTTLVAAAVRWAVPFVIRTPRATTWAVDAAFHIRLRHVVFWAGNIEPRSLDRLETARSDRTHAASINHSLARIMTERAMAKFYGV